MWFKRKEQLAEGNVAVATAVEEKTPEVSRAPIPSRGPVSKADLSTEELVEYNQVCKAIGLQDAPALVREKLHVALLDLGIHVYNTAQVIAYLDDKLGKSKWGWAGLRRDDVKELDGNWHANMGGQEIPFLGKQYAAAVPLPVLLTVKAISERCHEARFYVSELRASENDGDPFLLVTNRELGNYIVERWDEPGFRER